MKRNAAGVILLVVLSAAVLGAKYRLDNPPLSRADKRFRRILDRADEVQIVWHGDLTNAKDPAHPFFEPVLGRLHGAQIGELEHALRLVDTHGFYSSEGHNNYMLRFVRNGKSFESAIIFPTLENPRVEGLSSQERGPSRLKAPDAIHPHFVKRVQKFLEEYAPFPKGSTYYFSPM